MSKTVQRASAHEPRRRQRKATQIVKKDRIGQHMRFLTAEQASEIYRSLTEGRDTDPILVPESLEGLMWILPDERPRTSGAQGFATFLAVNGITIIEEAAR